MSAEFWPYFFAEYYSVVDRVAAIVAVIILISSIDDLIIDAWYWVRESVRAFTVRRRYARLRPADIRNRPEQPMAIMIPAWLEYDVIAPMLENMVATLDYHRYYIFVGTYINDTKTITEVERMRRRYRQLVRVEVPHPGPTCKADCLNWIIQAIFLHQKVHNTTFAGIVLHDSEDVLHPLELRFFNYLLPRMDLIQLPVTSLEREWYDLVAGTYMDEFAEWHAKDLVVRESLAGTVPSAGVGTCFSQRAIAVLAAETNNQPFNTDSLTEDYDVGARLAKYGMKAIFCRFPVEYVVKRTKWFGFGGKKQVHLTMPMCVREFFPDTIRTAYRQKARWTLGIGLQGWQQIGWDGSFANRYLLFRDRKGVVTSFVSILAYCIALQLIGFYVASLLGWFQWRYPSIFNTNSWLSIVLYLNLLALGLRVVQRVYFVARLYGWEHGLLSIPRMIVANFVNFLAAARAWRIFLSHLVFKTPIVWDKTMHDFPSTEAVELRRQRLGELLVAWRVLDGDTLDEAIHEQKDRDLPLGRLLIERGYLDEETLAEALAFQADLPRASLTAEGVQAQRDEISLDACIRWLIIPLHRDEAGQLRIASARPFDDEELEELAADIGCRPSISIARESEINAGLRIIQGDPEAFEALEQNRAPLLLGQLLVSKGFVGRDGLQAALSDYQPSVHGRIGDFLVERQVVPRSVIESVLKEEQDVPALKEGTSPAGTDAQHESVSPQ